MLDRKERRGEGQLTGPVVGSVEIDDSAALNVGDPESASRVNHL